MLILNDEQKVSLNIKPLTASGNVAKIDGPAVWNSSDEGVISLVVSDDGLSAVATAVGGLGTSQVSVTADADLGSGVRPLVAMLDIQVVASEAVSLSVNAGVPELK